MGRLGWASFCVAFACSVQAADVPYVNWENHPVHALDLSPDGLTLAVAHTADQRVQLFDVSSGDAVPIGHVVVGVDPVSVRFRSNNELWAVNHVSDSVSIVDVARRSVIDTLATDDEPYDVVFADGRAFVSCSQANSVWVFDPADRSIAPRIVAISGEDPRALAVSADGRSVYVAIFESGNGTTLLSGGLVNNSQSGLPNVVSDPRGPYGGQNPPPNAGNEFVPAIHPQATPPRVGLIVRKGSDARWRDDNQRDWTQLVSGDLAQASGRVPGWDLPDHDVAIIDATSLNVRYVSGLMNIGMALTVQAPSGRIGLIGTEATNEVRFEPNLNGRFVRSMLALVDPAPGGARQRIDLNPHLDYQSSTIPQSQRDLGISDPRAMVWRGDGQRGWIAGMGSNQVIAVDAQGSRVGVPIPTGQGPVALALDETRARLYVWNHFDASLSVIDTQTATERQRQAVFNPLPVAIREGRPFLYDSHRTSGLGQVACASCHVDARMDRLAWDLGDPSQPPAPFDQNCMTTLGTAPCEDFHAMKGPMTTQTFQDIIGHEPFHWRGDRAGLEAFNPAFESLLGDDEPLTPQDMQRFERFLATVTFPPNPYRNPDNSLPTALNLAGHYTSGRFAMAGLPLGIGNAQRGLQLYTTGLLDNVFQCGSCHSLPTGMAVNGPLFLGVLGFTVGGSVMPAGPLGENHLGIVSVDGSTNVSIKVPHLRNQYDKVGFELGRTDSRAGFGYLHDGSVDSISKFISARGFSVTSDQEVADIVALMLAFSGSDFGGAQATLGAPAPQSRDSHAAVGRQRTFRMPASVDVVLPELDWARRRQVDLIVRSGSAAWWFDAARDAFIDNDARSVYSAAALLALASAESVQTWTIVPAGLGARLAIDRDGDGITDLVEIRQGSNPADDISTTPRLRAGLWFNPQNNGSGLDVQYAGDAMAVTWYTYDDQGRPTWYQAAATAASNWSAVLNRFVRDPQSGSVQATAVGNASLQALNAGQGSFSWQIGSRQGVETVVPVLETGTPSLPDRSGIWFDAAESGWGLSVFNAGATSSAVVYYYDQAGVARWALGASGNTQNQTIALRSFSGHCPGCEPVPVTSVAAGSLQLDFDGPRAAQLRVDLQHPEVPSDRWLRGPVAIIPLSLPVLDAAQQ